MKIDRLLENAGWILTDGSSILFEHALPDGTQADYVLCDRQGRPMAALEAKRASIDPIAAQDHGRHYAGQLGLPFVFLSNGEEVRYLDRETDAHARKVAGPRGPAPRKRCHRRPRAQGCRPLDTTPRQGARPTPTRARWPASMPGTTSNGALRSSGVAATCRRSPSTTGSSTGPARSDASRPCPPKSRAGGAQLLVEMTMGTGKARTAAAFIKRLFEAGIVIRVGMLKGPMTWTMPPSVCSLAIAGLTGQGVEEGVMLGEGGSSASLSARWPMWARGSLFEGRRSCRTGNDDARTGGRGV